MTLLYLAAALLSALCFYLATAHQHWAPSLRAHARALRALAWALAAAGLAAGIAALGVMAGIFSALTAFMLGAVLLPWLDAWQRTRAGGGHVG